MASELLDGFAPWDGRRVPVTLLGGYLGAGKTTAINELLATTDRPIAVLVNDVGAVNIDAALIARRHGDTIELTDGCVCCSLSSGLADAFDVLRRRPQPPDHVVLELSGVADPGRVIPWADSVGFRLDGVLVLVDAMNYPAWHRDARIGPTVEAQLSAADLLLITKTDIAEPNAIEETERRLADRFPETPVLHSRTPLATASFLNIGTRTGGGYTAQATPTLFDIHHTTSIPIPDPIDLTTLDELLASLDDEVVRAKAIVRDPDGDRHLVQVVGRRSRVTPLPFAEDQEPTDLVVISAADHR